MSFYKSSTRKSRVARSETALAMGKAMISALLLFLGFVAQAHACATSPCVCYVNGTATGKNDGSSWIDAYTNPQFALLKPDVCPEIWVARGVYKPTLATDQTVAFEISPGVAMYGGFAGGETNRDLRDPMRFVTILSGDVDSNDINAGGSEVDSSVADIRGNNSYHVVIFNANVLAPILASTVLNGFTITGGNANRNPGDSGGGARCNGDGDGNNCSPSIGLTIFSGNAAANKGGAFYANGEDGGNTSATLVDDVFVGNAATDGGAMFVTSTTGDSDTPGVSAPSLFNVTFDHNTASNAGGAMYNVSDDGGSLSPILSNVTFSSNVVNGGANSGGAMFNEAGPSSLCAPTILNATFFENSASAGGALYNTSGIDANTLVKLTHVTFEENASDIGGAIYNVGNGGTANLMLTNVILWSDVSHSDAANSEIYNHNAATRIDFSVVQTDCPTDIGVVCSTLFTGDPKLGPLADNGGFTKTLLPATGSSALDTATDAACPGIDQRGIARPQGPHCDIGAVEVLVIQPPVAEPLSVTMPMNTSKEITLIGMDSNPGGPFTFSFAVTTRPAHGGFTGLAGVLNYTPDVNYVGPDTFEYTVTDANGTSLPATVTITVTGVIPVVQPMSFTTPMNVSKTITLTATDSNAGGPFTFTFAAAAPLHGTVSVSGDTAAYLPDVNYTGPDSFTYTATDVNGTSLPAIVTITVTSVPPVAEPRSIVVPHNTSKQITFAATDSNVGGPFTYSFTPVSSPAHGTLGTTVGNVVTYTPTHDYSGPDTFDYTATDANGTSIPVTVTITVLPVGGGPLPPGTTAIPALNAWGLLALAGLIGLTPLGRKRKI